MNNVTKFPTFVSSYKKLHQESKNELLKVVIEFYHHDLQSEPFLFIEGKIETVRMEEVEEHGMIINIVTPENNLTFTERNYYTNISGDAVVFSSKHDNETYCIIDFIKKG